MRKFKPIPIGIEDFKEMIDKNYYYVDNTLLIRDLLDCASKVSLITRPRRFGKTLNMSMLQRFFEKTEENHSYLFENLAISQAGEEYMRYMGQYPVISITLKSMKQATYEQTFKQFKEIIDKEFERYDFIAKSLKTRKQKKFLAFSEGSETDDDNYFTALQLLSECIEEVCHKKVIILIDEYDVPLENAYFNGFYDKMVFLIRSVFESTLKTNNSLEFAVLTGCLRISRESIFTGLNHLGVYSVTNNAFSEYFGFTEQHVKDFITYYQLPDCFEKIKSWYDGYLFGKTEIYNPWSVLNYIQNALNGDYEPIAYWINTSSNDIIHELIANSSKKTHEDIESLLAGKTLDVPLFHDVTYADMNVRSEMIWSFLLHTGYLKPKEIYQNGIHMYFKAILPNTEILTVYENTFRKWFNESIRVSDRSILFNAMLSGNAPVFELEINKWLIRSISYHDGYENFYHGFLVGLLEYTDEYLVESNREAGTGRSDIIIRNVLTYDKAVIIEIKSSREPENIQVLEELCDTALQQIEERQYQTDLINAGYTDIIKYGITFQGKRCKIKTDRK